MYRMLLIRGFKAKFQLGDNGNLWDYTYVKNVAHAHLLAADALLQTLTLATTPLDTERIDGEAFIITNDSPIYFWDFFRQVARESGVAPAALDPSKWIIIGTALAMVFATLSELIMGLLGKKPNFSRLSVRASTMTRYFSCEKAKTRLGYTPLFNLADAIKRTVAEVLPRQDATLAAAREKKTQ
jgi:sterol-4alpha-carboxylate 3-dehydrogenase (decarboxylating)